MPCPFVFFTKERRWRIAQWAEVRWWGRYLRRQQKEEYLQSKARYWRRILRQTGLTPAPDTRVLDAGCGPAGIFIVLDRQRVDAVDPLLPEYERRLPHFAPADYPNVRFHSRPLEAFKAEAPYPLVFCLNAINHVADLPAALDRLTRAVAPGGQLLLTVDAHNHAFFRRLFRLLPLDILHPHQYNLREYERMLIDREMRIEKMIRLKKGFFFDYYGMVCRRDS